MKTLILITALAFACLLAGCSSPADRDQDTTESATQSAQVTDEEAVTYATVGTTVGPTTEAETVEPEKPQAGHINVVVMDNAYMAPILSHDKIIVRCYENGFHSIKVFDQKYTECETFTFEDFDYVADVKAGTGDVLCYVVVEKYLESEVSTEVIKIGTDLTAENIGEPTQELDIVYHFDRKITNDWIHLVDGETGDMLVEGVEGEHIYHFDRRAQHYFAPIDENRFVYTTSGYEAIPGFGIYDYSTGKATSVPDSRDLIPHCVYGGYIYSEHTTWDGFGTEFYKTNIDTLKTEPAFGLPFEIGNNDYVFYHPFPSGEFILMIKNSYTEGDDGRYSSAQVDLYKVSVADGSIAWQHTVPLDISLSSQGSFLNEGTYLLLASGRDAAGVDSDDKLLENTLG